MFYIFSTGIQVIPANTKVNLAETMYTVYPIEVSEITTDVNLPIGLNTRDNVLVNFRKQDSPKWYFQQDSPIDYIYGTPLKPYRLKEPMSIEKNYIELIINNTNAFPVTVSIAFIGRILVNTLLDISQIDKSTVRDYNYQLSDVIDTNVINGVTIGNGKAILPIAPAGGFRGTVSFINSFDDYFELKQIWQSLFIPWDTTVSFRMDNTSFPIVNNPVYARQLFGTADWKYNLTEPLILKRNERIYIDIAHTQVAPNAPFPICFNFGGNLYRGNR